jgi:hypothetical protein
VRECERLVELEPRLPAIRDGTARPANPAEQIDFARLCAGKRLYAAAARLYAEAFAAAGKRAEELEARHRDSAACCAALAGCGRGEDAAKPSDRERSRLREQALRWLEAGRAAWARRLAGGTAEDRALVARRLLLWQQHADLAGVRDREALDGLPEGERKQWQGLWAEVGALLERARR